MALGSPRVRVAGSALASRHFMLLYAAMLVAAAGNTALQSVMPAIGREIGLSDLWVTLSYTWSAVLWVALKFGEKANSERITPALHRQRSGFLTRIVRAISFFLVTSADYTLTRRLNFRRT